MLVLLGLAIQSYGGEHGWREKARLEARISGLRKKLQLLKGRKHELVRATKLLAPGTPDRDMLEFQARELLDFVHEGEQIYVRNNRWFKPKFPPIPLDK